MKKYLIIPFLFLTLSLFSQNPIIPPGIYMADPAAQLWDDGRIYLYCSVDESNNWYCSKKYHVLSSDDMLYWELHENSFATVGDNDAVPYNDNLLFAPDCMYKDGRYYLYYCQPDPEHAEGVAVSKSPTGPFREGKPMDIGPYNEIDPGVFTDDDGTVYYLWGQFSLKMAKLEKNMKNIQEGSIVHDVITEKEHYFHEGAYMTKRNGLYYLVYADMSRGNTPTCIGYATSMQAMGPYTYRGVIVDNDHCDPQSWNNHGSIAEFNNQWYVFYHRSSHNGRMMRKACVEPITFLEDGSIPEVEMTTQGAGKPLSAFEETDAARACWMFGNVRIAAVSEHNEALCEIRSSDRAAYKYLDFGDGAKKATFRVMPGSAEGIIHLKLDNPWGRSIGQVKVPAVNAKAAEWLSLGSDLSDVRGQHALWLVFQSDDEGGEFGCSVDAFSFE